MKTAFILSIILVITLYALYFLFTSVFADNTQAVKLEESLSLSDKTGTVHWEKIWNEGNNHYPCGSRFMSYTTNYRCEA